MDYLLWALMHTLPVYANELPQYKHIDTQDIHWPRECELDEYTDYCLESWEKSFCRTNPDDEVCQVYVAHWREQ